MDLRERFKVSNLSFEHADDEESQPSQPNEHEVGAEEFVVFLGLGVSEHRPTARGDSSFVAHEPSIRAFRAHVRRHERLDEGAHPRRVVFGAFLRVLQQIHPHFVGAQREVLQHFQPYDFEPARLGNRFLDLLHRQTVEW